MGEHVWRKVSGGRRGGPKDLTGWACWRCSSTFGLSRTPSDPPTPDELDQAEVPRGCDGFNAEEFPDG